MLELEIISRGDWGERCYIDSLADEELIEAIQSEVWIVALEEGIALRELILDSFSIASRGEGLTMAILLCTTCSCCGTSGTSGVFGVALGEQMSIV